jgi:hypothetical protein
MELWDEILRTSIIGLERQAFSPPTESGALGEFFAKLDSRDQEGALYGAAAATSLYQRAGRLLLKSTAPPPDPSAPEETPRCPESAALRLKLMLQGHFTDLLPEYLEALSQKGYRAPEESLPSLLILAQDKRELRFPLSKVLGMRGRWLASLKSDWSFAIDAAEGDGLWETGTREQRFALIENLRKKDPARARDLVRSTWGQETPKDREEILGAFKHGISPADEPFLESALDDNRKDVRRTAAELLSRLPESAMCRRMTERVLPLLRFSRKMLGRDKIEVTLPAECGKEMMRDGIELKPPSSALGEKAWWLQQMLAAVPLKVWTEGSGWTVDEIIAAADRCDWKILLLAGWAQAAARQRDLQWIEILLTGGIELNEQYSFLYLSLPSLHQQQFLLHSLRADPALTPAHQKLWLLESCDAPWSEELSQALIDSLTIHARKGDWTADYGFPGLLNRIGRMAHPNRIQQAISSISAVWKPGEDRGAFDRFFDLLQFRYDMHKEIHG